MPLRPELSNTSAATASGPMIVVRFRDGRLLKGTTRDFAPNRASFHMSVGSDTSSVITEVDVEQLKAIYFVKDLVGDRSRHDCYDFAEVTGHGRKAEVTFDDGEIVRGFTMGYHVDRPGFFLVPADSDSNNERIYVVNAAVRAITWIR